MEHIEKRLKLLTVLVGLTLFLSLLVFASNIVLSNNCNGGTGAVVADDEPSLPTEAAKISVSADDDAVKGSSRAKVTIIEFSEFQCPYCARYYNDAYKQIIENYVDTGKVKYIFRDFPLGFHANAQKASEAAECAGDQDKYWEYHDKLFENQQALEITNLKQYAVDLGLDTAEFNSCLDSGKHTSEVKKDFADGQKAGISGTPSFFIGNDKDGYTKLVGAQPFTAFQQAIEAAL